MKCLVLVVSDIQCIADAYKTTTPRRALFTFVYQREPLVNGGA